MKILHQDRKRRMIKVRIDNPDDLWHLKNLIKPGDIVSAFTYRREEEQRDTLRASRGEKKGMRLNIEVEKVEFHEFTDRLRVLGVIVEGPQDLGSYHTLNLTEEDNITMIKDEWKEHHLNRLKEAVEQSKTPLVTLLAVEEDEATIAILRQYGVKEMARISPNMGGKMYDGERMSRDEFFQEVTHKLDLILGEDGQLIILGPGFTKEDMYKHLKKHRPELVEHAQVVHSGCGGMTGIHEVLKSGKEGGMLEEQRVSYESNKVEELLVRIKKDEPLAYGLDSVKKAVEMGAVETLLILDEKVRDLEGEKLMERVEQLGGKVIIISSSHEGGDKLEALGGYGGLLRYKIE
ncbi:MAG: mRNA surveillance protein pelota [Thermoplasmata archaeon]